MCSGRAGAVPGRNPGSGNRFRVGIVPGSEGCVKEVSKVSVFDGFRGLRFCSRGLDATGSGNRVPGTRGIKKVPGSGDSVPKVPKVTLYFESIVLYFEVNSCTLKVYFCSWKVYIESILLYFESILLYFEGVLLYFESMLL